MNKPSSEMIFPAGSTIMRQGEAGEVAYIIESGRVEIFLEKSNGEQHPVGTRGPGAMIGEMAIIDSAPRTATIRALEECTLLKITREDFSRRLDESDPILKMAIQIVLTRYRDLLTRIDIQAPLPPMMQAEILEQNYANHTHAVETVKMANEFDAALKSGDIALHYQPIVDLQSGRPAGFEALMRWEHKEKGFISPNLFIPVAEESGLILEASRWALKEACKSLKRIEQHTPYNNSLFMSVNFSSRDFAADDFVDSAYQTISRCDIQPKQIHLEITERMLMQQPDTAKETLELCRNAGMTIAIDDFGTGYSSLSYLHYFPINTLKIDRSFVMDMTKNNSSLELVRSIIGLARNLKMKVIAEGVETEEEANILKQMGCDMVQGYYFARPMTEKDVITYLKSSIHA